MTSIIQQGRGNRLLSVLSPEDYLLLEPRLSWCELERGQTLVLPDEPIGDAWFPISGLSSIIAISAENQGIEVGLIGREGLIGLPLLLDCDRTPHRVFMQVGGKGFADWRFMPRQLVNCGGRTLEGPILRRIRRCRWPLRRPD